MTTRQISSGIILKSQRGANLIKTGYFYRIIPSKGKTKVLISRQFKLPYKYSKRQIRGQKKILGEREGGHQRKNPSSFAETVSVANSLPECKNPAFLKFRKFIFSGGSVPTDPYVIVHQKAILSHQNAKKTHRMFYYEEITISTSTIKIRISVALLLMKLLSITGTTTSTTVAVLFVVK